MPLMYCLYWVEGPIPTFFRINFVSFQIEDTCTFMNIE